MSISLFSVVIVLIFLTVSAIEIYRGTTRGFYPALISLGTLVPSTCLALLITPFFSEEIVSMVFRYIIEPLPVYQQWLPFFPSLTPFLQGMAQIVLNVVLVVVVTLLLRLLQKNAVKRKRVDKVFVYNAGIDREEYRYLAGRSLLDRLFDGMTGDFLTCLVRNEKMSSEEIDSLKKLLDKVSGK